MRMLPTGPLVAACNAAYRDPGDGRHRGDAGRMAAVLGITLAAARARIQRGRVNIWVADRSAVTLGLHPASIWPDWYEAAA